MNKSIVYFLLLSVLLTGCEEIGSTGKIGFRVKSVDTKGTLITNANITSQNNKRFETDVWVEDGYSSDAAPEGHYFTDNVTYNGSWQLTNEHFWLDETGLCFWSWSPSSSELGANITRTITGRTNTSSGTLRFSYSFPNPKGSGDAGNQKDLLFAFNYQKYSESDPKDYVYIEFYHALAWVNFKIDTSDGTLQTEAVIKNISMSNIYTAADCEFRPAEVNSEDKFSWSNFSNPKTMGQNYNSNNEVVKTNTKDNFFMIPQTTRADAQLLVTFSLNGSTNVTLPVDFSDQEWLPGHYYTYKITVTSLQGISVECTVNDWTDDSEIYIE